MASEAAFSTPVSKNMNSRVFKEKSKKGKNKSDKLLLSGFDGFQIKWPEISPEVGQQICLQLTQKFAELNFKILTTKEKTFLDKLDKSSTETASAERLSVRQKAVSMLKSELVFGINEVTKGLEKNELALVIVDRSTKPFSMISHIPASAASRSTPAVAVDGLSASLANNIGVGSLVALAFKKNSPSFEALITEIKNLSPPIQSQRIPKTAAEVSDTSKPTPETPMDTCEADLTPANLSDATPLPDVSCNYKNLLIKRLSLENGRAEKLRAQQKRPTATAPPVADAKAPAKRKAKMVKLGKRHRAAKL
ncbi:hypothetical protein BV898_01993 [Hypsibius exemplaris]|uniref:Ribosomal protein eL8/eL30/eS12/Gadd45 domain-containing protein n=1 Tax=Hypsibius exemplaris TaxID=2072580 RepID=A0A1W0X9G2_HYPEX|nr:hypothetical protein BV898_01993 [Hypsibius exemplaris]